MFSLQLEGTAGSTVATFVFLLAIRFFEDEPDVSVHLWKPPSIHDYIFHSDLGAVSRQSDVQCSGSCHDPDRQSLSAALAFHVSSHGTYCE